MTPRTRTAPAAVSAVLSAAVLLGAAGCGPSAITRARVEHAVGPAYRNLYVLQQTAVHGSLDSEPPDTWARCAKGGPGTPDRGPGDDWVCLVHWPSGGGITRPISYELHVLPTGCYTAQGPAASVGQQQLEGADGRRHTNPLYEFDGCFDL